jgi:deoxyinosine 3'endonuclease (endonuclease V)
MGNSLKMDIHILWFTFTMQNEKMESTLIIMQIIWLTLKIISLSEPEDNNFSMILAFDTYYFDNKAKTVSICFDDWSDEENYKVETEVIENSEEYQSGEFYKRELPCILSLLDKIETKCHYNYHRWLCIS